MTHPKRSRGHSLDRQCFGRDIRSNERLICKLLRNVGGQAMRAYRGFLLLATALALAGCGETRAELEAWGHEHFTAWSLICMAWGYWIGYMAAQNKG